MGKVWRGKESWSLATPQEERKVAVLVGIVPMRKRMAG
jgi:hypothetical protein